MYARDTSATAAGADFLESAPLIYSKSPNYRGLSSTPHSSKTPVSPPVRRRPVFSPSSSSSSSSSSRRILDRNGYFHQSLGHWNIQRTGGAWLFFPMYSSDWFHSLLNAPTARIYVILFVSYLVTIYTFGAIYLAISTASAEEGTESCNMDISNMVEAYFFSLSTMTTIGYGVADYYFGDCWSPLLVISLQCCVALVFDSLAIGIIFQRLSRVNKRAATIVFSDRAVVRRVRGKLYFMFQVCELRKHQLIEAHVRLYCVKHERAKTGRDGEDEVGGGTRRGEWLADEEDDGPKSEGGGTSPDSSSSEKSVFSEPQSPDVETVYFQSSSCRLSHPSDSLGSSLLLSFPNVIVHPIDAASPLRPSPSGWIDVQGRRRDVNLHSFSCDSGSSANPFPRDVVAPPSAGGTSTQATSDYDIPVAPPGRHPSSAHAVEEQRSIEDFMSDREVELVVLVEGIDEMTSQTLQARHSYRFDDVVWHHTFAACVRRGADLPQRIGGWGGGKAAKAGGCEIDVSLFHDLVPCELDAKEAAMVANVA